MSAPKPGTRARGAIVAAGGLVGVAEAAAMLNVTTSNFGKVRGLPAPLAELRAGRVYLRCEVEELVARRAAS